MCGQVNALFLYPDVTVPGGVVEYVETIRRYMPDTVAFTHFPIGSKPNGDSKILAGVKPLIDAFKLFGILRRGHVDIVVLNPSFDVKSIIRDGLFLLVCRFTGAVPASIQFHGWKLDLSMRVKQSWWKRHLFTWAFGYARDIAVLSFAIEKEIISLGIDAIKVRVSHTVFDGEMLSPEREKQFDKVKFLFISRFIKSKGIRNLVEAFTMLVEEVEDVDLYLAGDGPESKWVNEQILKSGLSDRVHMLGYLTGQEKTKCLWESNVFILPSETEGFPVSLLEAMAAGNAIVITNVGCVPDIIEMGKNGVIMAGNSVEDILVAMRRLVDKKAELSSMSLTNRKQAWAHYEAAGEAQKIADRIRHLARP